MDPGHQSQTKAGVVPFTLLPPGLFQLSPRLLEQQEKPTPRSLRGCYMSKSPEDTLGSNHIVHGHLRTHGDETVNSMASSLKLRSKMADTVLRLCSPQGR